MKNPNSYNITKAMQESKLLQLPDFEVGYYYTPAQGVSSSDDALLIYSIAKGVALFAVADGVGSAKHGQDASHKLLKQLTTVLDKHDGDHELATIRNLVLDVVNKVNNQFTKQANYLTTLTLCVVHHGVVQVFQIGDSSLLVCGKRGKLRYKTIAHSPVGYAMESGLIDNDEAIHHPDNHYVDNLVGDAEMMIEMSASFKLAKQDTLLLASDGLFDNVLIDQLIDVVRIGSLQQVTNKLTDSVKAQKNPITQQAFIKDDDTSFIVVRLA